MLLVVIGPGLITAMADNDAGGVATYSVAAAIYGMSSQYLIVFTTLLLGVTQEIGARIAIVKTALAARFAEHAVLGKPGAANRQQSGHQHTPVGQSEMGVRHTKTAF